MTKSADSEYGSSLNIVIELTSGSIKVTTVDSLIPRWVRDSYPSTKPEAMRMFESQELRDTLGGYRKITMDFDEDPDRKFEWGRLQRQKYDCGKAHSPLLPDTVEAEWVFSTNDWPRSSPWYPLCNEMPNLLRLQINASNISPPRMAPRLLRMPLAYHHSLTDLVLRSAEVRDNGAFGRDQDRESTYVWAISEGLLERWESKSSWQTHDNMPSEGGPAQATSILTEASDAKKDCAKVTIHLSFCQAYTDGIKDKVSKKLSAMGFSDEFISDHMDIKSTLDTEG